MRASIAKSWETRWFICLHASFSCMLDVRLLLAGGLSRMRSMCGMEDGPLAIFPVAFSEVIFISLKRVCDLGTEIWTAGLTLGRVALLWVNEKVQVHHS